MTNLYVLAAIIAALLFIHFFCTGKLRIFALYVCCAAVMALGTSVIYYYNL
jgi:hypothetical protein